MHIYDYFYSNYKNNSVKCAKINQKYICIKHKKLCIKIEVISIIN